MSVPIRMPDRCCKCGAEHPEDSWEIEHTQTRIGAATLLMMWFGFYQVKTRTWSFVVPMCAACRRSIRHDRWIGYAVVAITVLLIIGGVILAERRFPPGDARTGAFALFIIGGLLVVGLELMVLCERLSKFNGKHLRFKNERFHTAFAELNPDLVKQPRQKKLTSDRSGRPKA